MFRIISNKVNGLEELKRLPAYHQLFWALTWRNVRLQYQNPLMGFFTAVIAPLLMTTIFYVVLGNKVGEDFKYYFLYIYSGFIFWNVFGAGLARAHTSFLQNSDLVKKIYFPRFLLPLTYLAAKLVDFAIALILFTLLVVISELDLEWGRFIYFSLLSMVSLLLICSGVFLAFSAICVRFRGFQMVFPFVSQAMFFSAPIVYDTQLSITSEMVKALFWLNPLTGVLSFFRAGVFSAPLDPWAAMIHTLFAILIFVAGAIWFKIEDTHLVDRL